MKRCSTVGLWFLLLGLCLDFHGCSIVGCAARSAATEIKDRVTLPETADEGPLVLTGKSEGQVIDELKRRLAKREEAASRMNAEAALLRKQISRERTEAQLATMRTIAWWLVAVSVVALIGFIFLKVWLKGVLSGLTTAGILTFGGVLVTCGVFLYFGSALLWIALLLGLLAVVVLALWGAKRVLDLRKAVVASSALAEDLLGRIRDPEVVKEVKRVAVAVQERAGVRRLINEARGKRTKKEEQAAPAGK